jgi:beta-phosphoglucomutase family hydrolase
MLGLPEKISTCLFDLDGVLTDTASVHRAAWKETFDPLLAARGLPEFTEDDYDDYVDGKPRADGVRDFLASRGITLPEGDADDRPPPAAPSLAGGPPSTAWTVNGVGNRKNELLLARIHRDGVRVYEGSRGYLEAARDAGLRRAVVSSSANTADVLHVTGLEELVEGRIDGVTIREQGLSGKPAPDSFLAGAGLFGVSPDAAVVFEDALAGVQAGRDGRFGFVVGVNRLDGAHGVALSEHGADVVVTDLSELL